MQPALPSAIGPSAIGSSPIHVHGHLDRPSRWLWLVKWVLALPHYAILAFLWIGFVVCALIATVAVLFTGRYPTSLFDYNVGVLRWAWRVAFYAYGANGTDRYPPFTLADVPEYPARLTIDYPAHQRRGLPLIGWWLAGIPQYLIGAVFVGGGLSAVWNGGSGAPFGLIAFVVLVAALVLLVRGEYPRQMFDFVLGLNRWALRVAAYAAVMTPEYPPFRLDAGEDEPAGAFTVASPEPVPSPSPSLTRVPSPSLSWTPAAAGAAVVVPPGTGRVGGWRVAGIVTASIVALAALASIAGGIVAVVFDQTQRDPQGYLMTSARTYSTGTYALVSASYRGGAATDAILPRDVLGTVRVRVASGPRAVFVGIAPASTVDAYTAGVAYAGATRFDVRSPDLRVHSGGAPSVPPAEAGIWVAETAGAGTQTLTWTPQPGRWRVVVMNADGGAGVYAHISVGARAPHLLAIGAALALGGLVVLLLSCGGVMLSARRGRVTEPV